MDTEREERQNFANSINSADKHAADADTTAEGLKYSQEGNESEAASEDDRHDPDYTDSQNNSSTGYTEKLLEKEVTVPYSDKGDTAEKHSDIEEDLVVKNGIIIDQDGERDCDKTNDCK